MQIIGPLNSSQPQAVLAMIPEGKAGTIATLKIMRNIIKAWRPNLQLRSLASQIVSVVPGKDWAGELAAIQSWVRDNIRYTRDIHDLETLHTPDVTLNTRMGDCDDQAILTACLLASSGHPWRLVAIALKNAPDQFVHVYTESRLGNKWVSVETTEPVDVGWEPAGVAAKLVIHP